MADISFPCPNCQQHLEAPPEMAGETVACPSCQKNIRVPKSAQQTPHVQRQATQARSPQTPRTAPQPPTEQEVNTNVKQGALIGGCVCFVLGILFMCITLWSVLFYAPLFFAAFVLSIVAMAQRRVAGGVLLLLGTVIIPPILFFAVPSFKKAAKVVAESRAKQSAAVPSPATPAQPAAQPVVAQQTPEPAKQTPPPERPKPTVPELRLGESSNSNFGIDGGESVVIDEIKITVHGVRFGYIEKKSMFGDSTRRSDQQYLIADITLENTSPGRIIYLQNIWEKTKVTDDFDNIEGAKFSDSIMLESIVGFIGSAKMKPGESSRDMIIFDLPVDAAKQFTIESDPGFWKSTGEDRVRQLSDSSFKVRFTRDQIVQERIELR